MVGTYTAAATDNTTQTRTNLLQCLKGALSKQTKIPNGRQVNEMPQQKIITKPQLYSIRKSIHSRHKIQK